MQLRMVLIGGGGSSGTHLLAQQMNGMGGIRVGPEVRITHQPALFDDTLFRRVFFKCLLNSGDQITYSLSNGATYALQPPHVLSGAPFYGIRTHDELFELFETSHTFAELVQNIRRRASQLRGWPKDFLWVEHSPRNGIFSRRLLEKFPGVRFIHMIRDGRDAVLSQYKRFKSTLHGCSDADALNLATTLWLLCQNGALLSENHPRCIRVKYEDFVEDPEYWLRELAHRLDIEYAPPDERIASLDEVQAETGIKKASEWSLDPSGSVSSEAVGKWRRQLTAEALRTIEAVEVAFPFFEETLGFRDVQNRLGYT